MVTEQQSLATVYIKALNYNYITDAQMQCKMCLICYVNAYHYKLNVINRAVFSQIQEPKGNLIPQLQRIRKQLSTDYP